MRLKDLETMESDFLTVEQTAEILGSNPQSIRAQAHENPDMLGFPICVQGSRIKIPRVGFMYWAKFGRNVGGN